MTNSDKDRIDELTLALLSLGLHRRGGKTRAWKTFDQEALWRLYERGLISSPESKNKSVVITPQGVELASSLLERHLSEDRPVELGWPVVVLDVELVDEWNDFRPVEPRVWRRFRLRNASDVTLHDLHQAIQDACGWLDYHLYSFYEDMAKTRGARRVTIASVDVERGEFENPAPPASQNVALREALREPGDTVLYEYDFGDSWYHRVTLVGHAQSSSKVFRDLIDGARAFPPEDAGGMPGYEQAVQVACSEEIEGLDESEVEDFKDWLGDWSPDAFDLEATKAEFDAKSAGQAEAKRKRRIESRLGYGE